MNERVKELAVQAGITTNIDTDYFEKDMNKWVDYYTEKFAELIVRECAKVAGDFEYARLHDSLVEDKIKEHFGVER